MRLPSVSGKSGRTRAPERSSPPAKVGLQEPIVGSTAATTAPLPMLMDHTFGAVLSSARSTT
jgi:hypothetical protein